MVRSRDSAENSIRFYLNEIGKQEIGASSRPANKQRALVADGKTLTYILDPRFVDPQCKSVRSPPLLILKFQLTGQI